MGKESQERVEDNNLKNIVIVGNGFDMSLGLKSSYHHFIEYIKYRKRFSGDNELYNYNRLFLRKYEGFHLNWSDFESLYEETVRKINNRSHKNEEPQDIFDISSINDSIKKLEEDFQEYLSYEYPKWVQRKTIEIGSSGFKRFTEPINPFFIKMIEDENTFFINFNYTNTVEDLCESVLYDSNLPGSSMKVKNAKDRVFHIHGSLDEENILFGGGFTDSEDINNIHYSQSLINDKLFRIKENESLNTTRKKMMSIIDLEKEEANNNLYIIGHSLKGSDFPFLSRIIKKASKVYIFYYGDDYILKMEEILREFGSSVAEKIVLVPFLEILLHDKLIVSSYKEYETISSFLPKKFPNEDILSELSLTRHHFSFQNINELRINQSNVEKVLQLVENLQTIRNVFRISRLYIEETIDPTDFNKLSNSKEFLKNLKSVNKVIFSNTEISTNFLHQVLVNGSNLVYIRMEHCTLFNNIDNFYLDISECESLKRLEIIDCFFSSDSKDIFLIKSNEQNNIENLTILGNTDLVIDNCVLEQSKNLIDLNIAITNRNVYQEEIHLKDLEILQIDHTSGFVPNITVGNNIEEIVIIGYSEKYFRLSSIMKNNEGSVGFPKLRLLHLKNPDIMTLCNNVIVDVILDVFSKDTKFIVDKDIKSINEYYLENKEAFNERLIDNNFLLKFKDLFEEISNLEDHSTIEEILEDTRAKLQKIIQSDKRADNEQKGYDINQKIEYNSGRKRVTNNSSTYTSIDRFLFDYKVGSKTRDELLNVLQQRKKPEIVSGIYYDIFNEIDSAIINSIDDVRDMRHQCFAKALNKIINDFSEKWFVSKDELKLSAIQYDRANDIPNIGRIIESRDFNKFKAKHPEMNTFRYSQQIKHFWKKELDEKVVWINNEVKHETSLNHLFELLEDIHENNLNEDAAPTEIDEECSVKH
ncbi:AbiH family protein [Rossellomorea aquimaris]|uniref:AbiH family protein n=1 Tax=Rossellomorea aquimaris TaxID=189382 RepID=UPI0011E96AA7|nr:AbiH family protein [Rossellomorea aquimaris]TYS89959.1 magnesium transporter [Rossellomorea aquimaris]